MRNWYNDLLKNQEKLIQWINIVLYCVGFYFFYKHFSYILKYSVDIPWNDDWVMLTEGGILSSALDLKWLFTPHEEHIIATTKFVFWFFYKINHWDIYSNIIFNFLVYLFTALFLCFILEKHIGAKSGIILIAYSSFIPVENHTWVITLHWHLFLFFCLLSFFLVLSKKITVQYLSIVAVAMALISYGASIPLIIFLSLYCFAYFFINGKQDKQYLIIGILSILFIAIRILTIQKSKALEGLYTLPTESIFWMFFLDTLSLGFGYWMHNPLPGIFILLAFIFTSIYMVYKYKKDKEYFYRIVWLLFFSLGVFSVLGLISLGRAKVLNQSLMKVSRYGEVSLYLFAYLLALFSLLIKKIERYYIVLYIILISFSYYLFKGSLEFKSIYIPQNYQRQVLKQCLKEYYFNNNFEPCKKIPMQELTIERLELAKKLNLSFYQKLILP